MNWRELLSHRTLRLTPSRNVARLPRRNAAATVSYSDRRSRGPSGGAATHDRPIKALLRRMRPRRKPRTRNYDVWDSVISGLGLRVGTSGHRSFCLRRTMRGRIRSATIGSADILYVPHARVEDRKFIASFIEPTRKDAGPRTPGRPMDAFAAEFLECYARHWKPRTLESNTCKVGKVGKYILPAIGHLTANVSALEHVRDWFASMAERPGSANRAMPIRSTMMKMAELWGYRPHNSRSLQEHPALSHPSEGAVPDGGGHGPPQCSADPRRVTARTSSPSSVC